MVSEEQVLASVAVAHTRTERRRVPLGRETGDGTVLLRPVRNVRNVRNVRTVGMRSAVDGALLLRTTTMARSRVGMPVPTAGEAVEAPAGSVGPPGLSEGDDLEVRL